MSSPRLILILPQGSVLATSLGIDGLAKHLSPGSGKHFQGRSLFLELRTTDHRPDFQFLDEGGWRDAQGDSRAALEAVAAGKRTKTALSNSGFLCTPLSAIQQIHVVKTGGEALALDPVERLLSLPPGDCPENLPPQEIARRIGQAEPASRKPRMYMVLSPLELLVISNLSPSEYAWYATRRPGKVFRQCCFAELDLQHVPWVAETRFQSSLEEITRKPTKKTKTVAMSNLMNEAPFHRWIGYDRTEEGGLYLADRDSLWLARFPKTIPFPWERAP
ncbi:hypothetical protein KBD49_07275 [Myxococcota bacterium]|nr:hypothetical protein [Myxococcota bacterium]